ncbi:hypothetical protein SAMN05877809_1222 [Rhodobacter sp. JA431]|nr:hypothetical protein SAMN05877809_1222 [Rhodobacter sp. JA431]
MTGRACPSGAASMTGERPHRLSQTAAFAACCGCYAATSRSEIRPLRRRRPDQHARPKTAGRPSRVRPRKRPFRHGAAKGQASPKRTQHHPSLPTIADLRCIGDDTAPPQGMVAYSCSDSAFAEGAAISPFRRQNASVNSAGRPDAEGRNDRRLHGVLEPSNHPVLKVSAPFPYRLV